MGFEQQLLTTDLAKHGTGTITVRSSDGEWQAGSGGPEVELDLSGHAHGTFELFRLLGSRRSRAQVATYQWSGDWRQIEAAIFHMALPVEDIAE